MCVKQWTIEKQICLFHGPGAWKREWFFPGKEEGRGRFLGLFPSPGPAGLHGWCLGLVCSVVWSYKLGKDLVAFFSEVFTLTLAILAPEASQIPDLASPGLWPSCRLDYLLAYHSAAFWASGRTVRTSGPGLCPPGVGAGMQSFLWSPSFCLHVYSKVSFRWPTGQSLPGVLGRPWARNLSFLWLSSRCKAQRGETGRCGEPFLFAV